LGIAKRHWLGFDGFMTTGVFFNLYGKDGGIGRKVFKRYGVSDDISGQAFCRMAIKKGRILRPSHAT
jgi:hypothetical protein